MANLLDDTKDFLDAKDDVKEEPEQPETDTEPETAEADTGADTDDGDELDPISALYQELELDKHYPGGPEVALKSLPEHRRHNEQLRREKQEYEERLKQYEADNREMLRAMRQMQPQQQPQGVDFDEDPRAYIESNFIPRQVGQQLYEYVMGLEQRLNDVYNKTGEREFASQYKDYDQVKDEVNAVIRQDPYLSQLPRERALEYAYLKVQAPRWQQAMTQQPPPQRPVAPADPQKKQFAQTTNGKGGRQPVKPTSYQQMWDQLDLAEWEKKYGEPQ